MKEFPSLLLACLLVLLVTEKSFAQSWRPEYDSLLMMEDTSVVNREQAGRFLSRFRAEPELAARTVRALGIIGDSISADLVLPFLERGEKLAAEAAFALGQMGGKSARPALEKAALGKSSETTAQAAEALGKLADSASVAVFEKLFLSKNGKVRYAAAVSAWKFRNKKLSPALAGLLSDKNAQVRFGAAWSLARFPDSAAIPALRKDVNDRDEYVRAQIVRPLGALKVKEVAGDVARLAEGDPHWKVRVNACRALAAMGAAEQAPVLRKILSAELLKKGQNNHLIIEAAQALGTLKDLEGRSLIRLLLWRPEPFLRAAAAGALATFNTPLTIEDLTKLAGDLDWLVRARAAEGLGTVQQPEAFELLTKMYNDTDFRVRYNALSAMGKYRDRDLHAHLRPAVSDHDFAMVATACEIIAQRKDSALFPELVESYRKDIHQTETDFKLSRLDAALALVDSGAVGKGDARLDSLLRWALEDPDRLIRKKGIELGKSAGKDFSGRLGAFAPRFRQDSLPKYLKILRENRVSVTLSTPRGDITILLLGEKAPRTAANFLRLCEAGYYDGLVFHRVVPNFVIQDGCRRGDGWGGPGYTLRCEYNDLTYERGTVGMALSGKDTGGSQYFIGHSPQPHLDGRYTIFGRVTSGMEVADAIQIGDGTVVKKITREPIRK